LIDEIVGLSFELIYFWCFEGMICLLEIDDDDDGGLDLLDLSTI